MNKTDMLEKVKELGLLAVIRGPSPELTLKMVEALIDGGVLGIEITYSTPNAEEGGSNAGKKIRQSNCARAWVPSPNQNKPNLPKTPAPIFWSARSAKRCWLRAWWTVVY